MKLKAIFIFTTLLASVSILIVLYKSSGDLSKHSHAIDVLDSSTSYIPWKNESTNCHGLTQWVVVATSGNKMTFGMVKIIDSTQQWCLLVMATHSNVWTVPVGLNTSNVIYLSITDLKVLPYKLASYAEHPINWKNVAYLYAIGKGARTIYDMEESITPLPINGMYLSVEQSKQYYKNPVLSEEQSKGNILWNPLSYFQRDNSLKGRFLKLFSDHGWSSSLCLPIIQHHLSVFNHKDKLERLVVPRGSFSPYTGGATIHLYEALWSLLLPTSLEMDIAAVWRSYVAQSLFYLIPDACLMFIYPASLTIDSDDDNYFSKESFKLVEMLKYFPMTFDRFEDALLNLYQNLVQKGFIHVIDYYYVSAWLYDLKQIGYTFPNLPDKSKLWTRNVQLCIMFNWGAAEHTIKMLLAYYMRFFNSILLIRDDKWPNTEYLVDFPNAVNAISVDTKNGWYQQKALLKCLQSGNKNTTSYLFIPDDMFINITMMSTLPTSNIWFNEPRVFNFNDLNTFAKDPWPWWKHPRGTHFQKKFISIVNALPLELKQSLSQNVGFPNRMHSHSIVDSVHIPQVFSGNLSNVLLYLIGKGNLFCEILIPLALDITAGPQNHSYFMECNLWSGDRTNLRSIRQCFETKHFIHPLKLSTGFGSDIWCMLMNEQMKRNYGA